MSSEVRTQIRDVLREHAGLAVEVEGLSDDSSLFDAGLSSMSTVNVMLALEDAFDVEFPESMLSRKTFESVQSICEAVSSLGVS
jgi:acyl carrier protein